ncbi:MAG: hypothetical protein E7218_06035, partial [Anaerofustis stercorihominis]|nr:hypothetical protein [Anaerofustis stercorihominis]
VIDIKHWEPAYTVPTQGYPQTSGVLTTHYEDESGKVYVYFFDNYTPGKLRVLEDKPGQNKATLTSVETYVEKGKEKTVTTAHALFTPAGKHAQYAICSPIVDENGTIYFKNDSAYLMAVGSTVEKLEITQNPDKMTYKLGEKFDPTGMKVTAHYTNGTSRDVTDYVIWSENALTANETDFVIILPYAEYQNADGKSEVECIEPFAVLRITIEEPVAQIRLGDVNSDTQVDTNDVSELLKYINGSSDVQLDDTQKAASDVNSDSQIDTNDVSDILKYINGTITEFPKKDQ